MSNIESTIRKAMLEEIKRRGVDPPEEIRSDTELLSTGLDSLGFATLVVRLEDEIGYDPFQIMDEPVYPDTFGEFVAVYEKFADRD